MKKKRQLLLWIIGLLLIITSLGGFSQGNYGVATIWLVVGLILLSPIREKIFSKKQNQHIQTPSISASLTTENYPTTSMNDIIKVSSELTNSDETTITIDEKKLKEFGQQNEKDKQNQIQNFQYLPQQVSLSVLQTLESIQIMDTTKNFDTLKGRHEFAEKKMDFLKLAAHNKRYLTDVQAGIDQYKTLYYDKLPTQNQIAALLKPNEFKYEEFHCQCILNSFNRFYDEQIKQIATLKREDAIKNRREKIMDTVREIQKDIPAMANSFNEVNDRLEKVYQTIFQETYG